MLLREQPVETHTRLRNNKSFYDVCFVIVWRRLMFIAFYILPLLLLIPIVIYMYICIARIFSLIPKIGKKTQRVIAVLAALFCGYLSWPIFRTSAMFICHFCVVSLLLEIINLIVKKKTKEIPKVWNYLFRSSVISLAVVCIIMVYGYYNIHNVQEKTYDVTSEKIQDSLRIGAISDLHLGNTMDASELEHYCAQIEKKKIDIIVLVGDIFDESTKKDEMQKAAKIFGQVKSTYGTYYVFGNHDANLYTDHPQYSAKDMCQALESAGVHVLQDEVIELDRLNLLGRQDASTQDRASIEELVKDLDSEKFTLLIDHQPLGLQENATTSIDLQLSGHTHAGQIWPTGTIMQLLGVSELNYGYKKINGMDMIVTSGIGGWGYPIRTGGHSEYLIIDVHS